LVDQLLVDQCLVDQLCPEFMLENLNKIELDNPVDLILSQIRELISTGAVMNFIQYKVCNFSNNKRAINEHQNILAMITDQDADGAVQAMEQHLFNVKEFSKNR